MKKILSTILISLVLLLGVASFADAKIFSVRGYIKPSTGRYVAPHYKTTPNKTKFDNFSTKGNVNPFTGKKGTISPFKTFKLK
jgi:hypothetical protein